MIKITTEPNKFKTFISQVLGYKKSPLTDTSIVTFDSEKAMVTCAIAPDIFVLGEYAKSYFDALEVNPVPQQIMITQTLLKNRLASGFSNDKITIETTNEDIKITGSELDDKVTEKLESINLDKIAPYAYIMTEVGLVPYKVEDKKTMKFIYQVQVPVDRFMDTLPEEVRIVFDTKLEVPEGETIAKRTSTLNLMFKDTMGSRVRPVPILATQGEPKACTVVFNFDVLQSLISLFTGNVWISVNDDAICISQMNKDYSLSYVFASKEASD
jgi:hypothetical protein